MVSLSHVKLLSKTMQGSDDEDEVNKSEEFEGKHFFFGRLCFTGVSGSCMIPSLARSASQLIPGDICPGYLFPFFFSLGIFKGCFGLFIIQITSQRNENSRNWDETLE